MPKGKIDPRLVRALLAAAGIACAVALAVAISGGISFRIGGWLLRARQATPPLVVAGVLAMAALAGGRTTVRDALVWWWMAIERHALAAALAVSAFAVATGVLWGTFAAGGSDSYCYLNQAELFARGEARDREALATDPAWPGTPDAFVPAGHNPSPLHPGSFVPICPAGYPLILAGARLAAGRTSMFWVTPILGGLLVFLVFLLARRLAGPAAGLLAALLAASSPIVIYQIVQPMNDVPAAALWAAALVAASRHRGGSVARGLSAGALTGIAVTIRPNLLPLAAVVGLFAASMPPVSRSMAERLKVLAAFAGAATPGIVVVMAVQQAMHGSPLRSGYGDLSALFSMSHVLPNLVQYSRWVLEVHTPVIVLAAAAPLVVRGAARRTALLLLAFAAATLACYLPYVVFDAWWYQRFLLPAVPLVLASTAAVIVVALQRLPAPARAAAYGAVATALVATFVTTAAARGAFGLGDFEARYRTAGEYVGRLDADAVVITSHHSGSVRFYANRSTADWAGIEPGRLSEAIAFFRARGRTPYLLIETWEQAAFRERFAGETPGGLEWPPMVEIDRSVRVYDPADYDRYMRDEPVRTERVLSR